MLVSKRSHIDLIKEAQFELKAKLGNSVARAALIEGFKLFSQTIARLAEEEHNNAFEKSFGRKR